MIQYFVEKLCPDCEGRGCINCNDTGAVEVEVDSATFYERYCEVDRA